MADGLARPPPGGLTAREQEVAELMAEGCDSAVAGLAQRMIARIAPGRSGRVMSAARSSGRTCPAGRVKRRTLVTAGRWDG